jgi:UDP-galactopyranose mutase
LIACFGEYFATWIMIPYEEKKWQMPLEEMDSEWVKTRPINIALEEMVEGAKRKLPPSKYYYYPKYGRIDNLTSAMAREAGDIIYNAVVKAIDLTKREVLTNDGRNYHYNRLISTLPLDYMVQICYGKNNRKLGLVSYKENFRRLGIFIFDLVFKGNYNLKGTAIYFPEKDFVFRRVCVLQNLCPSLRRDGLTPITAEVSINPKKITNAGDSQKLYREVLEGLAKIDQFRQMGEPLAYDSQLVDFAYPLQVNGLAKAREEVIEHLRKYNVYVCGRGGNFDYCNCDVAYKQGKDLAEKISSD